MKSERQPHKSWVRAIEDADQAHGQFLPPFEGFAMGVAHRRRGDRLVTIKRRFVSQEQADIDGIQWTLIRRDGDHGEGIGQFRESQIPHPERVAAVLAILKGWLLDGWSEDRPKAAVAAQPNPQPLPPMPAPATA